MVPEPPCVLQLYRAIRTLRALPDPDLRWFAIRTSWPQFPREWFAYSSDPDDEAEPAWQQPTPHDVSVYLEILAWGRALSPHAWRIMRFRAQGYSLQLISDMLRTSLKHIEQDHAEAVCIVTEASLRMALDSSPQITPRDSRHHCA